MGYVSFPPISLLKPLPPPSEESLKADEGHEVLDTARGFFDHNGGVLSSVSTGVSIVIPKGALPEGIRQEIFFKVCRDTNMLPPLDKDKGEMLGGFLLLRFSHVFATL